MQCPRQATDKPVPRVVCIPDVGQCGKTGSWNGRQGVQEQPVDGRGKDAREGDG